MVFQDPDTQIIGDSVYEEVAFGPENLGLTRDQINDRVGRTLNRLGLKGMEQRDPATLSGGEKRRLALAGILVMEPDLIVFDEPFANLDYPSILSLVRLCRELHRAGHAIVMTTPRCSTCHRACHPDGDHGQRPNRKTGSTRHAGPLP